MEKYQFKSYLIHSFRKKNQREKKNQQQKRAIQENTENEKLRKRVTRIDLNLLETLAQTNGDKDDDDDGKRKQNGIIEVVDDVNLCIWFVGNQNMIFFFFLVQNKTKDQTNKQASTVCFNHLEH